MRINTVLIDRQTNSQLQGIQIEMANSKPYYANKKKDAPSHLLIEQMHVEKIVQKFFH